MATIGQTLAAARVNAGYTVADLSARTRIREPVLAGIEGDDFGPCGGDFYARGHIRNLCRQLGLDPAPLIEHFDKEHAQHTAVPLILRRAAVAGSQKAGSGGPRAERRQAQAVPQRVPADSVDIEAPEEEAPAPRPALTAAPPVRKGALRRHWPWAVVLLIVAASVVVGVRAWSAEDGLRLPAGPPASEPAGRAGVEQPQGGEPVPRGADTRVGGPEEFSVSLSASERSWISVRDDTGRTLFTGFLDAGAERTFAGGQEFDVRLGDAGAVRVAVDGEDLGRLGATGEARRLTVGPGGIED